MTFSTAPRRRPSFAAASMSEGLTPFAGDIWAPRALVATASRKVFRRSSFCAFLQPHTQMAHATPHGMKEGSQNYRFVAFTSLICFTERHISIT